MKTLSFNLLHHNKTDAISFTVKRVINAGFAARNQDAVNKHIEELKKEGVRTPKETPTFYPVSPCMVTQDNRLHVLDGKTSGEAEFVLLIDGDNVYVGVGSDHTDRDLEVDSIPKAKLIYPNVISQDIWRLDDLGESWDEILLRSWVRIDNETKLYQEDTLKALLMPDELLNLIRSRVNEKSLDGYVIYSGTIPIITEKIIYGDAFTVELLDHSSGNKLGCNYDLNVMDFI